MRDINRSALDYLDLSDKEVEMLRTAVHQTCMAWLAQRPVQGLPQELIDQQCQAWEKLAEKLENL